MAEPLSAGVAHARLGRAEPELGWSDAVVELALSALRGSTAGRFAAEAVVAIGRALGRDDVELWERDGDRLRLQAAVGASADLVGATAGELESGYLEAALSAGGLLAVADWAGRSVGGRPGQLAAAGALASVAVGVEVRGRVVGVLAVHLREPGGLGPGGRRRLGSLARLVGEAAARRVELAELRRRVLEDPLTELANRAVLHDRLGHALEAAARRGDSVAVLFVDLDGFKQVNDEHGHQTGDRLLVAVARRLEGALRRSDTLTRAGGDEFVLICELLRSPQHARDAAERLRRAMHTPFVLAGGTLALTATIGVSVTGQADVTAEQLLSDADRAMYAGKQAGGDRVQLHEAKLATA